MEEKLFRYSTKGSWFKGNTHLHSTCSDGGKTHSELEKIYAGAGYDFLYRTDHWHASDVERENAPSSILWMDGVELDGRDANGSAYHVVCLGRIAGLTRDQGFPHALEVARSQGALLILAHPHWMGNSLEDACRHRFHGVEVYNHVCHWLNGKSYGGVHWDACLERFPDTLAFAADDAHLRDEHPGWNGGWIMVNAPECTRESIQHAVHLGNFYSSCGPEFHGLEWDGEVVTARTSPIQFACLAGPQHRGERKGSFDGELTSEVRFTVPVEWDYVRMEIADAQGRRAWTNPLFTKQAQS